MTAVQTAEATVLESPDGAVRDSITVAVWTLISRITGLLRGIIVAAVLGTTFFANTYQFAAALPNQIYYGFLGGSLFASLLIPAIVKHLDTGDMRSAARVAGGFFGAILAMMLLVIPAALLIAPFVFSRWGVGGAAILFILLAPMAPLYGVVGAASAVTYARQRYALPAAAPAIENIGTIVVLLLVFLLYGRNASSEQVPFGEVVLLGAGTTGAVGVHAALQWWGARRSGVSLLPRAGWKDPEVRTMIRHAMPSLAQAGLVAVQFLVLLLVASRVPGGGVAFQLATNFYFLPIALAATPVALSLAPRLSRLALGPAFRDTLLRGLSFAMFLAIPAAVGYAVLAGPLATAMAHGGFDSADGVALISAALLGISGAVVGGTAFLVLTYASYARKDTATPLYACMIQTVLCLGLASFGFFVTGPLILLVCGLAQSISALIGAIALALWLYRDVPRGALRLRGSLLRGVLGSVLMTPIVFATAYAATEVFDGATGAMIAVFTASVTGAGAYLIVHLSLNAPETSSLVSIVKAKLPRRLVNYRLGSGWRQGWVNFALLLACTAVAVLMGIDLRIGLAFLAALGLGVWVFLRPAVAAYLIVILTPLTAGIDRGTLVPVLRPNEAIALAVGVALVARWLIVVRVGEFRWPKVNRIDAALLGLAVCSSIVPILIMMLRSREVSADDYQHAIVLWKYFAVYILVRCSVKDDRQVRRLLVFSVATCVVVVVVGMLQALGLFGVPALLGKLYAPFGVERTLDIGRGGSTLGLPAAVADLAIINLALAVALMMRGSKHKLWLAFAAVLCVFGVGSAGEFSSMIGLIVAAIALGIVTGSRRLMGYALPVAAVGSVVLWPVISTRLAGFQSASGLPDSWLVRLYNLQTYFWPELAVDNNWIFGVRPSARVPASHEEYGFVWIESGHTWLLWGGGLPLLAAYVFFIWVALQRGWSISRSRRDAVGAAATAVFAAVAANTVLMLFDPHLTYRGAADALYVLLACLAPLIRARDTEVKGVMP